MYVGVCNQNEPGLLFIKTIMDGSRGLNLVYIDMAISLPSLTIFEQMELAAFAKGVAVLKHHLTAQHTGTANQSQYI